MTKNKLNNLLLYTNLGQSCFKYYIKHFEVINN